MTTWTFETLAQADRKTLEDVLLTAQAPDLAQIAGRLYDGYNRDRPGQLVGEKFRKAFYEPHFRNILPRTISCVHWRLFPGAWMSC